MAWIGSFASPESVEVPDKPSGQLFREYGEQTAKLGERVDYLQGVVDRLERDLKELRHANHSLDKRAELTAKDVERSEKKVDDLLFRRWEYSKLILAALLSLVFGLLGGFVAKSFELSPNQPTIPSKR